MTAHSLYNSNVTGTPEEKALSHKLAHTFPGQASFAEATLGKECRQCGYFTFNGYDGQRAIKQGTCKKYFAMSGGRAGPKFPGTAIACKHFETGIDHPKRTGMEGDYRQVHGPDHLWRETRRGLREAKEKGQAGTITPLKIE